MIRKRVNEQGKSLSDIKLDLKRVKPQLEKHYGVKSLGVFGSYVRHEENRQSDLDLLIEFNVAPSLIKFVGLENYLSDILGVKVDLVMKSGLKPNIGENILHEVIAV